LENIYTPEYYANYWQLLFGGRNTKRERKKGGNLKETGKQRKDKGGTYVEGVKKSQKGAKVIAKMYM
jgi:hypothetical protein